MPPVDRDLAGGRRRDWKATVLLAWAIGVGVVYARMVLDQKAPGWSERLSQIISGVAGAL